MDILRESCYEKKNYMRVPTEIAIQLYFYVQWAGYFVCAPAFYVKRSHLSSYLLIYTLEGSGTLTYRGQQYMLSPNTLCFLNCQELQEYTTVQAPWKFKFLHFSGNLSDSYHTFILHLYGAPVFPCAVPDMEILLDHVIQSVYNSADEATCSRQIYKILTTLISTHNQIDNTVNCNQIIQYITENYMEDINCQTIADAFHLSRSYFTVKFKAKTGIAPYVYLTRCRVAAAKDFLLHSNFSIQTISEKCGFSSCSAFIRTFKKVTGTTPLAFKKNSGHSRDAQV